MILELLKDFDSILVNSWFFWIMGSFTVAFALWAIACFGASPETVHTPIDDDEAAKLEVFQNILSSYSEGDLYPTCSKYLIDSFKDTPYSYITPQDLLDFDSSKLETEYYEYLCLSNNVPEKEREQKIQEYKDKEYKYKDEPFWHYQLWKMAFGMLDNDQEKVKKQDNLEYLKKIVGTEPMPLISSRKKYFYDNKIVYLLRLIEACKYLEKDSFDYEKFCQLGYCEFFTDKKEYQRLKQLLNGGMYEILKDTYNSLVENPESQADTLENYIEIIKFSENRKAKPAAA